jgi:hypothetical protein
VTKDPVAVPLDIEHVTGGEISPALVEDIVQVVSLGLKSAPEMLTVAPGTTDDGFSASVGSTVNVAEAQSAGHPVAPTISIV